MHYHNDLHIGDYIITNYDYNTYYGLADDEERKLVGIIVHLKMRTGTDAEIWCLNKYPLSSTGYWFIDRKYLIKISKEEALIEANKADMERLINEL